MLEGYDYLIDGKNVFHDLEGKYTEVSIVLKGLNNIDSKYVEMVLHPNGDMQTPLGIAEETGNKRIV